MRKKRSFKRQEATRPQRKTFYLFCEGKNTEPHYFEALKQKYKQYVDLRIKGAIGVPMTITKEIIKEKEKKKIDNIEDQYWAVFDCDEHPCYERAKKECHDRNIPFAYSDPCFELWHILHFQEYDKSCKRHDVQKLAETLIEGYERKTGKTTDFYPLLDKLEEAEERAEKQRQNRETEGRTNGSPSTSIYELTRAIKKAIASS